MIDFKIGDEAFFLRNIRFDSDTDISEIILKFEEVESCHDLDYLNKNPGVYYPRRKTSCFRSRI